MHLRNRPVRPDSKATGKSGNSAKNTQESQYEDGRARTPLKVLIRISAGGFGSLDLFLRFRVSPYDRALQAVFSD